MACRPYMAFNGDALLKDGQCVSSSFGNNTLTAGRELLLAAPCQRSSSTNPLGCPSRGLVDRPARAASKAETDKLFSSMDEPQRRVVENYGYTGGRLNPVADRRLRCPGVCRALLLAPLEIVELKPSDLLQ